MHGAYFTQKIGKNGQFLYLARQRHFGNSKLKIVMDESDKDNDIWAELMGH